MPASASSSIVVEGIQFPAGPYLLEGALAYDERAESPLGGVVIAGGHPLLGGNMHNNVVRGLGDGLAERGLVTLRFNYRSVGRSQGRPPDVAKQMAEFWQTSHVADEMDLGRDVQGAVDFLRLVIGSDQRPVLIGYSFGCALLPSVLLPLSAAAYVLIAPPLSKHDYSEFTRVKSPTLVIASENDFACESERLREWFDSLPQVKALIQQPLDNHFFRGHEAWLTEKVFAFVQEHLI